MYVWRHRCTTIQRTCYPTGPLLLLPVGTPFNTTDGSWMYHLWINCKWLTYIIGLVTLRIPVLDLISLYSVRERNSFFKFPSTSFRVSSSICYKTVLLKILFLITVLLILEFYHVTSSYTTPVLFSLYSHRFNVFASQPRVEFQTYKTNVA